MKNILAPYYVLLLAIMGASLGYAMGLADREDSLQRQNELKIERKALKVVRQAIC